MEWVQLVLPQEGMLSALLCYRQRFGEDGCAQVSREKDGYAHSILLAPDSPPQLFEQIEQQLCDMGYLPVVSAEQ